MPDVPEPDLSVPKIPQPSLSVLNIPEPDLSVPDIPETSLSVPAGHVPGVPDSNTPEPSTPEPGLARFDDLGLSPELLATVRSAGFVTPTPIQERAIPALLSGRDVVGLAPTGTGKTAAFGLPILAAVDAGDPVVQALVLTPTRELALQVATAVEGLAAGGVRVAAIYGGAPIGPQIGALRRGCPIVVGTPGRVIDHLRRGTLDLGSVGTVVLDEADEMLRMGFAEDIDVIMDALPGARRTALFSATMPPAIRAIAARHLKDPIDVTVAAPTMAASLVHQQYAVVASGERTPALVRVLSTREDGATIVFVRTRAGCQELGAELAAHGIAAAAISGDIAQPERERIIERLRDGRLRVLVATDVAARGLDVDRIDHVVNYGAPNDVESYVHRVGRTGRAGRTGEALTLVTPREIARIRTIEKVTGVRMTEIVPPTAADVVAHRSTVLLTDAIRRMRSTDLTQHRAAVSDLIAREGLDAEDLAAALVALAAGDYPVAAEERQRPGRSPQAERSQRTELSQRTERFQRAEASQWPERSRQSQAPQRSEDPAGRSRATGDRWAAMAGDDGPHRDSQRPATRPLTRSGSAGGARAGAAPVYRVDVGRFHGVRPSAIVGAITGEGGMAGKDVGKIDIYDTYSTVEISAALTSMTWDRISRAKVSGRPLKLRRERGAGEADGTPTGNRRRGHDEGRPQRTTDGHRRAGDDTPRRPGDAPHRRPTSDGHRRPQSRASR